MRESGERCLFSRVEVRENWAAKSGSLQRPVNGLARLCTRSLSGEKERQKERWCGKKRLRGSIRLVASECVTAAAESSAYPLLLHTLYISCTVIQLAKSIRPSEPMKSYQAQDALLRGLLFLIVFVCRCPSGLFVTFPMIRHSLQKQDHYCTCHQIIRG